MSLFDIFKRKKKPPIPETKPEKPASEPAKDEMPQPEPPKAEAPQPAEPETKPEKPVSEPAKAETPKPAPKAEAPKPPEPEAKPEKPAPEPAKAETPKPEPTPEPPKAEAPQPAEPETKPEKPVSEPAKAEIPQPEPSKPPAQKKASLFTKLKGALSKTRKTFSNSIASVILGKKVIDEELLEEIETILLTSDLGLDVTESIIDKLTKQLTRNQLKDPETLMASLKDQLLTIIKPSQSPLQIDSHQKPYVILMVGINGAGKTTTIGKLAKRFQEQGKRVMLAAGDTFRAAAVEQLQAWGERNAVPVIAQHTGADSASVIFDAVKAAKSRDIDVIIADTAGRLHTKQNLMEELKKVVRVIKKLDENAPHEVMLVLDAGTGQNALIQAKQFNETIPLTGITITKLDGTARGGMLFAIASQLNVPIRFIGVGEQIDDLRPFNAEDFVAALFEHDSMTVSKKL